MKEELATLLLPEYLLDYFVVTKIQELGDLITNKMCFYIYLEEKNELPNGYNSIEYQSKGFLSCKNNPRLPNKSKALYLIIKRRRWRNKQTRKEITSDYSFIAEGSKITAELSDFLKGTGRDPRRYDK